MLYSNSSQALVSEEDWVRLAQSLAKGDQSALHALYERRASADFRLDPAADQQPETAEELTLDIFDDLWRKTCRYEPAKSSVLAWIMNQAPAKAIDWLRLEQQRKGPPPASEGGC